MADVTRAKARKILRDGQIGGRPLSRRQRGFFGSIAGGDVVGPRGGRVGQLSAIRRRQNAGRK